MTDEIDLQVLIPAVLALDPAAQALEFDGRGFTWGALAATVHGVRAALAGRDAGGRVGVLLRNRPPHVAALLAVLADGGRLVTLNPLFPDAPLSSDIGGLALAAVVGAAADLNRPGVMAAAEGATVIALPEILGDLPGPGAVGSRTSPAGDAIIEMLTSGTTGPPKRVPLLRSQFQRAFGASLRQEAGPEQPFAPRLRPGCRIMAAPMTHIGGAWGALRCVCAGREMVLMERFALAPWLDAVRRRRPVSVALAPPALKSLLDADVAPEDLSSLKAISVGTAPIDPAVIDAFWARYRLPILVNYGATEFSGPVAAWSRGEFERFWSDKRGSVGRLNPGVCARIVDAESGEALDPGAEGLLELKGPQLPDPDRWLQTTDLGRRDADGFLWITGRADAVIVRGGFKVAPEDVQRALQAHPDVEEAVVVGIADVRLGSVPAAAIVLKPGAALDLAGLERRLRERLSPYQMPVLVHAVEQIPRNAVLKPLLGEVRELLTRVREGSA